MSEEEKHTAPHWDTWTIAPNTLQRDRKSTIEVLYFSSSGHLRMEPIEKHKCLSKNDKTFLGTGRLDNLGEENGKNP